MEKIRNILNSALRILAGGSLAVMVILTCWQVLTRYVLGNPSTWSEELVGYLFAWSTMFGAALISGERGHMNIPILSDKLKGNNKKALNIFSEVVAMLFALSILVFGGIQITSLAMGQMTSSLGVAVGVFYTVLPICGSLIVVYSILNIIGLANGTISLESADTENIEKKEDD